nr:plasmid pRiA4b ORF-3 family protein [Sinorhizobium medicae]
MLECTWGRILVNSGGNSKYRYDFGDGWTHRIKIERIFPVIGLAEPMLSNQPDAALPRTSAGHGAIRSSARRSPTVERWGSEDYDPDKANFAELNKAVDDLAARRQSGPANHAETSESPSGCGLCRMLTPKHVHGAAVAPMSIET